MGVSTEAFAGEQLRVTAECIPATALPRAWEWPSRAPGEDCHLALQGSSRRADRGAVSPGYPPPQRAPLHPSGSALKTCVPLGARKL